MAAIDNIKTLLESKEELQACYYGAVPPNIIETLTTLNYAGINRGNSEMTDSSLKDVWGVTIVFEEQIPDDYVKTVMQEVKTLGWRIVREKGIEYNYSVNRNTLLVLESATFYVCKSSRCCL